jgi:hypothetical protein
MNANHAMQRNSSMMRSRFHRRPKAPSSGTTVVETALVLPVFLLFVLGMIELAHAQMVKNVLRSACRQAARIGSTDGTTSAAVQARLLDVLDSVVDPAHVQIYVKDGSAFDEGGNPPQSGAEFEAMANIELADAQPRQLFLVRAKVSYSDVAIVPHIPYLGSYLDNVVLEGQAFMRHE